MRWSLRWANPRLQKSSPAISPTSRTHKHRCRELGKCRLTYDEFSYVSENESFTYTTGQLKALAFSSGQEFEMYHNDEMHYFYPDENKAQVARWAHIVDIIKSEQEQQQHEE